MTSHKRKTGRSIALGLSAVSWNHQIAFPSQVKRRNNMKLTKAMVLTLILTLGSIAFAQGVASDIGKGTKDIGKGAETVGKDTAKGTKKVAEKTAHGSKDAGKDVGKGG